MSRTREQLRRRRWLRRIWLAVLAAAVAALCAAAWSYAVRLDGEARERQAAEVRVIRYWDLAALEAAMGTGEGLYAARIEVRP